MVMRSYIFLAVFLLFVLLVDVDVTVTSENINSLYMRPILGDYSLKTINDSLGKEIIIIDDLAITLRFLIFAFLMFIFIERDRFRRMSLRVFGISILFAIFFIVFVILLKLLIWAYISFGILASVGIFSVLFYIFWRFL